MNRADVVAALEADAAAVAETVSGLPDRRWNAGVYENGWTARQLLAHIAAIEWTYPKLIEQARDSAASGAGESSGGGFDMDAYNRRQVEKRADAPVADLLDEFSSNRAATIAALREAEDELLAQPTRSAGGVQGTLLQVFASVAVDHVREHLADLRGGT